MSEASQDLLRVMIALFAEPLADAVAARLESRAHSKPYNTKDNVAPGHTARSMRTRCKTNPKAWREERVWFIWPEDWHASFAKFDDRPGNDAYEAAIRKMGAK
jgi:hypothetical protein